MLSTFKQGEQPGAIDWLLGSVLYLIEMIGVTMVGNIPLHDALAIANPTSTQGAALWLEYLTDWTVGNHVRTIAAFFAAALFSSLSLCARAGLSVLWEPVMLCSLALAPQSKPCWFRCLESLRLPLKQVLECWAIDGF